MSQITKELSKNGKYYYSPIDDIEQSIPVLPLEGLIRIDTVLIHYQVSKAQLYQEISEGTFPKQIKIGRSAFWDARRFRDFLKSHGANISSLPDHGIEQ